MVFIYSSFVIFSFISIFAIVLSSIALFKVLAYEKSTHKMEFVPYDQNWASSDKQIKEYNEKMEQDFPEWEDNEVTSEEEMLKRNLI